MLDTCDVNISMVCNHCKSLLEETYICNPFESLLNITVLLVRLAQTITCTKYLGIKYHDLCFQERNYCYMLAYTTICSTLIDCTKLGASPFSWLKMWVKPWSQDWFIAAGTSPGFCSMKLLEVFLLRLDGMLIHCRSLPCNLSGFPNNLLVPIYTPGWREALWEWSVLPKNTTQCPRPRLEPGPIAPESSALTMRPPRLP